LVLLKDFREQTLKEITTLSSRQISHNERIISLEESLYKPIPDPRPDPRPDQRPNPRPDPELRTKLDRLEIKLAELTTRVDALEQFKFNISELKKKMDNLIKSVEDNLNKID
jgi:hypothetical protein